MTHSWKSKICLGCGKEFLPSNGKAKYCGHSRTKGTCSFNQMRKQNKKWYAKNTTISKPCSKCGKNPRGISKTTNIVRMWCDECVKKKGDIYRAKNKDLISKKNKEWAKNNPDKSRKLQRDASRRRRLSIITHYSNGKMYCECCKESNYEFLTVDHINGGGRKHRKELGNNGQGLYNWLKKNKYPPGFRILCYNCNSCYGHYNYCPHNNYKLKQ